MAARNVSSAASRTQAPGTAGSTARPGRGDCRPRTHRHRQADPCRPGGSIGRHGRLEDALLESLDVSRIGLGNDRVGLVAEHVHGQGAGMRVGGRDQHVRGRDARGGRDAVANRRAVCD